MTDKMTSSKSMSDHAKGGSSTGGNSGPTGSSRSYPKGSAVSMKTDWNPQKCAASTIYVGGV